MKFSLRHQRFWIGGFRRAAARRRAAASGACRAASCPRKTRASRIGMVQMPPGSTMPRTREFMRSVSEQIAQARSGRLGVRSLRLQLHRRRRERGHLLHPAQGLGRSRGDGHGVHRRGPSAHVIGANATASAFFVNLPTIRGLGAFGGFDFWLEDRTGAGRPALYGAHGRAAGRGRARARWSPACGRTSCRRRPQLKLKLDRAQAQSMGLSIDDVYSAVQLMLAPVYVNDFFYEGRVLRVTMQADAPFRMNEDSLQPLLSTGRHLERHEQPFAVAGDDAGDGMVPLSSVLRSKWGVAAPTSQRASTASPAININGNAQPGHSSGEAMDEMERIVDDRTCRPASAIDWAAQSFQELLAGAEAPLLFGAVHPRRVPVPRGAVRKLGDAHRGDAGRARGHHRRDLRGMGHRAAERRVLQGRPHHHHRPGREERDPDRRVRARGTEARASRCTSPSWKPRGCACVRS